MCKRADTAALLAPTVLLQVFFAFSNSRHSVNTLFRGTVVRAEAVESLSSIAVRIDRIPPITRIRRKL